MSCGRYLRKRGEGRRFLAFLFGLHPRFIDDIHTTVKNQLPCNKSLVEAFGEVYFRAWRGATGQYVPAAVCHHPCGVGTTCMYGSDTSC